MGLFSKLVGKKESEPVVSKTVEVKGYADSSSIDEDERPYYQDDSYYTFAAHQGTPFEKKVITFDERKKISYPSESGLYVPEILLLEYVSYGTYPKPKNGYPGLWWFQYGIRDVGNALKSLAERGYIQYDKAKNSIKRYTVPELKEIAQKYDVPVSGKKAAMIEAIVSSLSEEDLDRAITERKYVLTEKGEKELHDNGYVPYMHKHTRKTIENIPSGEFTVWSINKVLKGKNVSEWREIVGNIEMELFGENMACSDK